MREQQWDHVVIGAGSAGSVLANRLTEDPTCRVLLLEAGREDWHPYLRIPAAVKRLRPGWDWLYPGEPDPSRGGRPDIWNGGKVTGGGSSVNAMVWVRGHRADFDHWAELGCDGWDYASILPYYRRGETFEGGGDPEFHGYGGPLHVSPSHAVHPLTNVFIDAAHKSGHAINWDYNGAEQEGVSPIQVNQKRGLRHSTARAYLAPARRRPNLTVRTHAFVTRMLFDGARCVGVEYQHKGRVVRSYAGKEVVLSAGAIASPKILMLSGIGPADDIARRGIPVIADSPGVGRNLQDHPNAAMLYEVNVRTLNQEVTPLRGLKHVGDFVLRGRGALTTSVAHAVIFGRVEERSPWSDYEVVFIPFGIGGGKGLAGAKESEHSHDVHKTALLKGSAVMAIPGALHPEARGVITLRSSHPADLPVIRHEGLGHDVELSTLIAACRATRDVFGSEPMKQHVVREMLPGPEVESDADWAWFLRRSSFRGNHPVGTCKMGNDDLAVVDPQLRVRGVSGLSVIDASIMPTITSANTNAPTIMIAEKGADLIKQRHR